MNAIKQAWRRFWRWVLVGSEPEGGGGPVPVKGGPEDPDGGGGPKPIK
jgi:hypothetical protein